MRVGATRFFKARQVTFARSENNGFIRQNVWMGENAVLPVRAVLFDLGGTLWAPFGSLGRDAVWTLASEAALRRLEAKGICRFTESLAEQLATSVISRLARPSVDPESTHFHESDLREADFDTVFRDSVQALGMKLSQEDSLSMSNAFQMDLDRHYEVFADTLPSLRRLRQTTPSVRVGIVSNTCISREVIEFHLAEAGIRELTDFRILSSVVGWRKPHRAVYAEAVRCSGTAPQDTVFVGDRLLEDVVGPKSMGMKALLRGHGDLASGEPPAYDGLICDLSSLLEVLQRLE